MAGKIKEENIIDRLIITPFQKFARIEGLGGILLFGATVIAIFWANSPWGDIYQSIWEYRIGVDADTFELTKPSMLWVNDALMAVFFFLIGLEIKRELLIGELNSPRKAALPLFAAMGGMIVPVSLYFILNDNPASASGWGIPMATDIAFSLAIINALGKRVPVALKVFLTAFAIVDDIGAVLVIAIFYSEEIKYVLILLAFLPMILLGILGYLGFYSKYLWIALGVVVWLLFLKAGIHPTIAGVMLAFTVPIRRQVNVKTYTDQMHKLIHNIETTANVDKTILSDKQIQYLDDLEEWTVKVQSPLQHLEHKLHYWVAFFIMPLFALANAGVVFDVGLGIDWQLVLVIAVSLFLGKFIGIPLFTYIGLRLKLTELPNSMTFSNVFGAALLAGVGFTMSIFISNLAFTDDPVLTNSSKIGILIGSLVSGLTGYILMRYTCKLTRSPEGYAPVDPVDGQKKVQNC
ncbi:MAG: Na+/H+ antiporter NhaA [Bacteroides sp.]|jgi:NhaA family Na+:H+ antiporter|nr:Na+/H+ antiporter NhaA [Bacteroides sp.]